jgi:hypothetical protein
MVDGERISCYLKNMWKMTYQSKIQCTTYTTIRVSHTSRRSNHHHHHHPHNPTTTTKPTTTPTQATTAYNILFIRSAQHWVEGVPVSVNVVFSLHHTEKQQYIWVQQRRPATGHKYVMTVFGSCLNRRHCVTSPWEKYQYIIFFFHPTCSLKYVTGKKLFQNLQPWIRN